MTNHLYLTIPIFKRENSYISGVATTHFLRTAGKLFSKNLFIIASKVGTSLKGKNLLPEGAKLLLRATVVIKAENI